MADERQGQATNKRGRGRPSLYSEELAATVLDLIREGHSEAEIGSMPGMPSKVTIRNWKNAHDDFLSLSVRAREESAALFRERALREAEKLSELATKCLDGQVTVSGAQVFELPRTYVEAKKVLIQELNREASMRDDRNFGDRKRVKVDADLKHNAKPLELDLTAFSDDELQKLDELINGAGGAGA